MNHEKEISNLLRRLGVNNSYVGFRYTIYGVIRTVHDPTLLAYISKGLYVDIAVHYQTSIGCVERNIRTLINTIWLHGDRKLLNEIFDFELSQKPRNGAFIDALVNYIVMRGISEEITEPSRTAKRPYSLPCRQTLYRPGWPPGITHGHSRLTAAGIYSFFCQDYTGYLLIPSVQV